MRSVSIWERLGSEAEAMDRAQGSPAKGSDLTDEELRGVLASFFAVDLCRSEICEDEEAALDALVNGYRKGG